MQSMFYQGSLGEYPQQEEILPCPIVEVATHPNINGCSSAYEWRNETNYGCLESTCIPLTVSGGCEEFHLLVEDCWAVSDKRGKLPILEVFGQSL